MIPLRPRQELDAILLSAPAALHPSLRPRQAQYAPCDDNGRPLPRLPDVVGETDNRCVPVGGAKMVRKALQAFFRPGSACLDARRCFSALRDAWWPADAFEDSIQPFGFQYLPPELRMLPPDRLVCSCCGCMLSLTFMVDLQHRRPHLTRSGS